MKLTFKIFGLLILLAFQSCKLKDKDKIDKYSDISKNIYDKYSNDSLRNQIFKIAYQNTSTAPSYIVFKAIDMSSSTTKEICCEAPFLSGALHRELGKGHSESESSFIDSLILNNKDKVFEFKSKAALRNIRFYQYPDSVKIKEFATQNEIEYYFKKYGSNDTIKSINFIDDTTGFEQLIFAHLMFKGGLITSRDCVSGNYLWIGEPRQSMPLIHQKNY